MHRFGIRTTAIGSMAALILLAIAAPAAFAGAPLPGPNVKIESDSAILVPAGARRNVKNTGEEPLKLYTLYGPPEHADATVRATKADAMALEEHFAGKTTE